MKTVSDDMPEREATGVSTTVAASWYRSAVRERDGALAEAAEWRAETRRLRRIVCTCTHGDEHWVFHATDCRYRLTTP